MALIQPTSMEQCVYFTNRTLENEGRIKAWASKLECPKCKEGLMGKPKEKGKVKIRATEYKCDKCGYTEEKKEHEEKLKVGAVYTCPHCGKEGEGMSPYKRKSWKGVQAFIIECEHCGEKIPVTKKMKQPKKK